MRYPGFDDYMKAVQQPDVFTTDELRLLELVVHPVFGIPSPASGTSAVVFKATESGQAKALRFFTRADAGNGQRYNALHDHFVARDLLSAVALPRWIDDGIRVNGRTWPVVRMQWVEGHTLNRHVDELVSRRDTAALAALAETWRELVNRLQRADFAHGDLQHGNVLVDDRGAMRLVDFDCSWIAAFASSAPPSETGHRNYQPANRAWDRWMDTFPGLVVYLSLLALAKNPERGALNTGENLLFAQQDFQPPFATPAWSFLSGLRDGGIDDLAARLKRCCSPGWTATGGLDALLAPAARPWWERTSTVVAGTAPTAVPAPRGPTTTPATPTPPRVAVRNDGTPTAAWWKGTTPAPPEPVSKRPRVRAVLTVATVLGLVVALLSLAIDFDAPGGPIALALGVVAFTLAAIVGLVKGSG
ncbi:phosphotransferase [Umezawaea endophytica]